MSAANERILRLRKAVVTVLAKVESRSGCRTFRRAREDMPEIDQMVDVLWAALRDDDVAALWDQVGTGGHR
jgi:hypothetical protein